MSYIIAHVIFDNTGNTYPVNCLRTDLKIGDEVVVKMSNRPLKWARIADINYLNWNCQNTIECLASEAKFTKDGIVLPSGDSRSVNGLARPYDLAVFLYKIGWVPRRAASKMYRMAYSAQNRTQTSLILMRKNGIDVQIINDTSMDKMIPNSALSISRSDGPFIGQPFHGSLSNILERTADFAQAFLRNEENLEAMVEPLQTTKILPKPPPKVREGEDDLYSALGGAGEPIYLSDGVWLTSDGGAHDWGR
ncbi:MAG: hypothetical protein V9G18_13020 [Albidovulum sp.]